MLILRMEKHIPLIIFQFPHGLSDVAHCRMGTLLVETRKGGIPSPDKLLYRADIDISIVEVGLKLGHVFH